MRSGFEKCIAAVLFAAVCAYLGARLFTVLEGDGSLVLISETICEKLRFEGMALRNELPLGIPPEDVHCDNAERIPAGYELAAGAVSPASAIYMEKCDGFEYLSPPQGIITADIVHAFLNAEPHPPSKGRLVTGKFWFCAVIADGEIPVGKICLRIEPQEDILTGYAVKGEGNAYMIRLPLGDKKYFSARKISGEILLKEYTGLAAPDSAVYEKDGKTYVCVQASIGAEEIETEVLYRTDGKVLLKSDEKIRQGMKIKRNVP